MKKKSAILAVLLVAFYVWEIFVLSKYLGMHLGISGTVVHEMILASGGVLIYFIFFRNVRSVFRFKMPEIRKLLGTVIFWLGSYCVTMAITMVMMFFYPEEMILASQKVNQLVAMLPLWSGILVVALTPAVFEEFAFRGVLLPCFDGLRNKWIGIVVVGLIFGACHGSIWRMVPTAILGIAMGYLLVETENMCYNMLFHFINNALPVFLLWVSRMLSQMAGLEHDLTSVADISVIQELSIGSLLGTLRYFVIAPLLIYLGIYLLHKKPS